MARAPTKASGEYICKYEKEIAIMMTNIATIQESIRRQETICRERITSTATDRSTMTQQLDTLKQLSQHLAEFKTTYEPLHEWYHENKDIKEKMEQMSAEIVSIRSQLSVVQVGFAEQVTNILNTKIDQGISRLWLLFKIISGIGVISGGTVLWIIIKNVDVLKKFFN